jgi:hypothetical protein
MNGGIQRVDCFCSIVIHSVQQTASDCQYEATCFSAQTTATGTQRLQYKLVLHHSGHGSCTCQDFSIRGGACKHLRALWLLVDNWVERELIHPFHYLSSQSEASQLAHTSHMSQSKITHHTNIPPSFNNAVPSMLTSVLALCQLSGENLPSEGNQDQDRSG